MVEAEGGGEEASLGHALRGVSAYHLGAGLIEEAQAVGLNRHAKVYEIEPLVIRPKGAEVICPRDKRRGAAYVDCLRGADAADFATVMLSYTWGYAIGDIADSVASVCALQHKDPKRFYVWICCLCINQHRVKEAQAKRETVPFDAFRAEFGKRVEGIGHMVAMMSPWDDPGYVKRVWCDFEMYTAVSLHERGINCEVSVTLPPADSNALCEALQEPEGVDGLWKVLSDLRIEKANASVPEDRENIFKLIKDGPGFHNLNSSVASYLQTWVTKTCCERLDEYMRSGGLPQEQIANLSLNVGNLLRKVGQMERSSETLLKGKEIRERAGTLESPAGADLLLGIGILERERGNLRAAASTMEEAWSVRERTGSLETTAGARLMTHLGRVRREGGDLKAALTVYERARQVFTSAGRAESPDYPDLLLSIGLARKEGGDLDGAAEAYEEALGIRERCGSIETPEGAQLLRNMGVLHLQRRNLDRASDTLQRAKHIREQTATLDTIDGAVLLHSIGIERSLREDRAGAKAAFEEARAIREMTGTLSTKEGKKLEITLKKLKQYTTGELVAMYAGGGDDRPGGDPAPKAPCAVPAGLLSEWLDRLSKASSEQRESLLGRVGPSPYARETQLRAKVTNIGGAPIVCLVTQCSLDRLEKLEEQLVEWDGEVSAAVFVPAPSASAAASAARDLVAATCARAVRARIARCGDGGRDASTGPAACKEEAFGMPWTIELVYQLDEKELRCAPYDGLYPVNALRNVALAGARAELVFLLDVDFVPSHNLYQRLVGEDEGRSLRRLVEGDVGCGLSRVALVVPAFEIAPSTKGVDSTLPRKTDELWDAYDAGRAEGFHVSHFPAGHRATGFERWWQGRCSCRESSCNGQADELATYKINYEEYFEPYVVMARRMVPACDERFRGYGLNKIAHLYEINARGFEFRVIDHVDAFVAARAHPKSDSWWRMYGPDVGIDQRMRVAVHYENFKAELHRQLQARVEPQHGGDRLAATRHLGADVSHSMPRELASLRGKSLEARLPGKTLEATLSEHVGPSSRGVGDDDEDTASGGGRSFVSIGDDIADFRLEELAVH